MDRIVQADARDQLAEFLATGSRSTRWFHGLSAGKIGQFGAAGSGWAGHERGHGDSAARPTAISATELRATSDAGARD